MTIESQVTTVPVDAAEGVPAQLTVSVSTQASKTPSQSCQLGQQFPETSRAHPSGTVICIPGILRQRSTGGSIQSSRVSLSILPRGQVNVQLLSFP